MKSLRMVRYLNLFLVCIWSNFKFSSISTDCWTFCAIEFISPTSHDDEFHNCVLMQWSIDLMVITFKPITKYYFLVNADKECAMFTLISCDVYCEQWCYFQTVHRRKILFLLLILFASEQVEKIVANNVELSFSDTWYSLYCHKLWNKCKC